MSVLGRLRDDLRQRRYPPEFRIARPEAPAGLGRQVLVDLQEAMARTEVPATPPGPDDRKLLDAVTSLWRARNRVAFEAERGIAVPRMVHRHLERAWDLLADAGIRVLDHDGRPFDPGQALETVDLRVEPGLTRETVVETIRPTIYIHDQHVQIGQVVVGQPPKGEA